MAPLQGARDFVVNDAEFTGHQNIQHQNINIAGRTGIDVLLEASAPEAAVDAVEQGNRPSCYPGTREQYIQSITDWVTSDHDNHLPVYWMHGPAAVGKSAIAQTCAQKVKDLGHLGAAFFFSINGRTKDHARFFPTIAYQLSTVFAEYREILNRRVLSDKTLVSKTMKTQFESLIAGPLMELKSQGKELAKKSIFIDGLDGCESNEAQVEIIEIIAVSVLAGSTPFCWAVFSRAELQIASTFELSHLSPHCLSVHLPVSRDINYEIELYLRGGFEDILRRQDSVLVLPRPSEEDIKKLVDAAGGLFHYASIFLRFINTHSYSGFHETLQTVLEAIAQPCGNQITPFAEIDQLYALILRRVPQEIRPVTCMLLHCLSVMDRDRSPKAQSAALVCNWLGISGTMFKRICNHLQAVITYQKPLHNFQVSDPTIDLNRSYFDQDSLFKPCKSLELQLLSVHGTYSFVHTTFRDFLLRHRHSPNIWYGEGSMVMILNRMMQQHIHLASSYLIEGSHLTSNEVNSSASLSWPQGSEFVDSFIKLWAFRMFQILHLFDDTILGKQPAGDYNLTPNHRNFFRNSDYRKVFIAESILDTSRPIENFPRPPIETNHGRQNRWIEDTHYRCIPPNAWDQFNTTKFWKALKRLRSSGIIRSYHPRMPAALAYLKNLVLSNKPGKRRGVYEIGRGERSVIWFWELDTKEQYFCEIWTLNFARAIEVYEAEGRGIWEYVTKCSGAVGNGHCATALPCLIVLETDRSLCFQPPRQADLWTSPTLHKPFSRNLWSDKSISPLAMALLEGAHDFVLNNAEFNIQQSIVNVGSMTGIDFLLGAATPEAALDSGERRYDPLCYPGTREQYIQDITRWATRASDDKLPIYWMHGPAGVGKSAIAQTSAQKLKDSGHLGGAFFFSISGRRNDHTRFFPTIAYQLSTVLVDYREIVDRQILIDKTLVSKTMKAQFQHLIAGPLMELKSQGKEVARRSIFVDGLDECQSKEAQAEIIEIIAASVRAQSTPFCWAVFSRAEPQILSTFELSHISPYCSSVHLPISRDIDHEIELYLRGSFENMLRRRNLVMDPMWPTDEDIKKLLNGAAGLFAYASVLLRFIDTHSVSGFQQTFSDVLKVIMQPRSHEITPFKDLDRLYTLILQRVPEDILPSMHLLLFGMVWHDWSDDWRESAAVVCNALGISETIFRCTCNYLRAVIVYHERLCPFEGADMNVDLTRSYFEQGPSFKPSALLRKMLHEVHGTFGFLHKSFRDFLLDPSRSSAVWYLNESAEKYFDRLSEQSLHYAPSYIIKGMLWFEDIGWSTTRLGPPQVSRGHKVTCLFLQSILNGIIFGRVFSSSTRRRLLASDSRKVIIACLMFGEFWPEVVSVWDTIDQRRLGRFKCANATAFRCIQLESDLRTFSYARFLRSLIHLRAPIRPYHPKLPSALSSVYTVFSLLKPGSKHGLYEIGRGEQSAIWYWEYDPEKRYYRDFWTVDFSEAMEIYKSEGSKVWENLPPSRWEVK
ncbi:hypothetical protein NP233_g6992 [Leucocoprinus birnbaumii]|uniref:Nephrocystin 3-like N-terminal domain-containing protein n=1 Tax=Leucocoprinus birnbaumii TaxID=56174 RepID=A0AAD5VQ38_9AGAR|nr:hypothetical protein NP233_g6992 [Leucocoprinus birnbaumii]